MLVLEKNTGLMQARNNRKNCILNPRHIKDILPILRKAAIRNIHKSFTLFLIKLPLENNKKLHPLLNKVSIGK